MRFLKTVVIGSPRVIQFFLKYVALADSEIFYVGPVVADPTLAHTQ